MLCFDMGDGEEGGTTGSATLRLAQCVQCSIAQHAYIHALLIITYRNCDALHGYLRSRHISEHVWPCSVLVHLELGLVLNLLHDRLPRTQMRHKSQSKLHQLQHIACPRVLKETDLEEAQTNTGKKARKQKEIKPLAQR